MGQSAYLLDTVQSILNTAARLILRIVKYYDPISAAIRRDLHCLPVPFRIPYKLAQLHHQQLSDWPCTGVVDRAIYATL